MILNVARRPRFKRVSDFPSLRLTSRDSEILSAVCRFRFLTTRHIISLVPGSHQNIARRLQRLYHARFLDRPQAQLPLRFAGKLADIVYSPTKKSFEQTGCPEKPDSRKVWKPVSSLFLLHALSVSNALIQIETECKKRGFQFRNEQEILNSLPEINRRKRLEWRLTIKSGRTSERVGVIPDAIFSIDKKIRMGVLRFFYFLEVDRGTMPLHRKNLRFSSIRRKALAYIQTRRKKVLQERYGIPGFQVLFISRTKKRMEGIEETCIDAEKGCPTSLFLFAKENDPDYFLFFFTGLASGTS